MHLGVIRNRVVMLAVTGTMCAWLTLKQGPWVAVGIWTASMVVVCTVTALLMQRQAAGRVTIINRLAGLVLPWGYTIGRGQLVPIVITSCVAWMLLGLGAALATSGYVSQGQVAQSAPTDAKPSAAIMALLYLAWLIDGVVLLRLLGIMVRRQSRVPQSLVMLALGLAAMITISAVLALRGEHTDPKLALLIAGGPPLLIGGGYGAFVLVVVLSGKNTRWN